MCFDRLPNELAVMILSKFALQKRLRLRQVSPRWLELIENAFMEITSLKLFGSRKDVKMYFQSLNNVHPSDLDYWTLKPVGQDDDLMIVNSEHFSEETCDLLSRLFVNVKHLIVHFRDEQLWENVPYLLKKFNTVNSLSLCGQYEDGFEFDSDDESDEEEDKYSTLILQQVNSMKSLKRLDLLAEDFFNYTWYSRKSSEITYRNPGSIKKIFPRLERFSLNGSYEHSNYDHRPLALPWGGSEIDLLTSKCTHLSLKNIPFGAWHYDEYSNLVELKHLKNLEFLYLKGIESDDEAGLMYDICLPSSLQSLWLHFCSKYVISNDSIMDGLMNLRNLSELRLDSDQCVEYDQRFFSMSDNKTVPLESVKHISFFNFTFAKDGNSNAKFDGKLFCQSLSAWFPNLEELFICSDTLKPNTVTKLEENVNLFPHLIKHRFEKSCKGKVNSKFSGRQ